MLELQGANASIGKRLYVFAQGFINRKEVVADAMVRNPSAYADEANPPRIQRPGPRRRSDNSPQVSPGGVIGVGAFGSNVLTRRIFKVDTWEGIT